MQKANTYWVLFGISMATFVAGWINLLPESLLGLPESLGLSLIICQFLGKFKEEVPLEPHQKDFVDRMVKESENLAEGSVVINILNAEGKESKIIINLDGSVEFEGEPDPEILRAARELKDVIIKYGPEIVARELMKRLDRK